MKAQIIRFPEAHTDLQVAFLRGLPSEATRKAYKRCLRQFQTFLDPTPMIECTRRDVEAWRSEMETNGRAPSTICRALAALSGFFQFAEEEGAVERNPVRNARRPKIPDASPRHSLTPREVTALFDATDPDTLLGLRDRVFLALLAVQGLRVSETLDLLVEDLAEEQSHQVATIRGKGGKVCVVPLALHTSTALNEWLAAAGLQSGPVLVKIGRDGLIDRTGRHMHRASAWERLKTLARRAGIQGDVYPHRLRHTAVTEALRAGIPLHQVQDFARHSDPKTTRRYDSHRQSLANPTAHVLGSRLVPQP